jgi:hypothetical protein
MYFLDFPEEIVPGIYLISSFNDFLLCSQFYGRFVVGADGMFVFVELGVNF